MNEIVLKNNDFVDIYNKSYRLAAAVFVISNVMDENGELKTKIKNLALSLVSIAVNLKDINFLDAKKLAGNIGKISLELMAMLDIASVSGLISKMNGDILKEEFQSFITELGKFSDKFENNKNVSVKNIFSTSSVSNLGVGLENNLDDFDMNKNYQHGYDQKYSTNNGPKIITENNKETKNGHKRKESRKSAVLEFIKGHNNVSIKDIMPNINGCSEKTVQRELISLINEGKIRKEGERRWSRYSIIM